MTRLALRLPLAFVGLLATASLAGCAFSTAMINPQGKQVMCASWGFGYVGGPAAFVSHEQCVSRHREQGFIPLDEFEKTEGPKIEQRPGLSPPKAAAPEWKPGDTWTYSTGYRERVAEIASVDGTATYLLEHGRRSSVLTRELGLLQVREDGRVIIVHRPARCDYEWPLEVGRTWTSETAMERRAKDTGAVMATQQTCQKVEVRAYGLVTVPAGTFEAFYVVKRSCQGLRLMEYWYAPDVRGHVKRTLYLNEGRVAVELTNFARESAPARR